MKKLVIAAVVIGCFAAQASAQNAYQFQWRKDQTLNYRVRHVTSVTEIVQGNKIETSSQLDITKRWRIVEVDAQGGALLEQSIVALRNEQKRPGGDTLLFDSADPEKSTPELKGMSKFLNTPIAIIRVDGFGQVVEVKQGPKNRFDAEPPFVVVVPKAVAAEGQAWVRPFTLTLEPPLGNGEKHDFEQKISCAKIASGKAQLAVTIQLKSPPLAAAAQVPLLQKQMQGQVVFDLERGVMLGAKLSVDRTVEGHQGNGSSYRFASSYLEEYVEPTGVVPASGTK